MTILDQITKGVGELVGSPAQGTSTSSTKTAVMSVLLEMIEDGKISLQSLINKFHASGMQEQVKSWVSDGKNFPLDHGAVLNALGQERLDEMSRETGLPADDVAHQLSAVIPTMIDKFTPTGEIPEQSVVQQAASLLRTKLVS